MTTTLLLLAAAAAVLALCVLLRHLVADCELGVLAVLDYSPIVEAEAILKGNK